MASKPKTFDECLAAFRHDQRAALEKLRNVIRAAAPGAEEYVGYGLAAFRLHGKPLVALGATVKHCAFYPMSGSTVEAHAEELADFDTGKGTIRFPAGTPLPSALVEKLVKARIAENAGGSKADDVQSALDWLKNHSTQKDRDNLARFGIVAPRSFGVSMATIKVLAKELGKNHDLAAGLWATGWYEARMLAALIDEPAKVAPAQMERWCKDFDNWAICDTVCFHLFDRTPYAFRKVKQWSNRRAEFERRAAFALLASVALHDKHAADGRFAECLPLVEKAAIDGRNFVKKGLVWALRGIGGRSWALHTAATAACHRLIDTGESAPRWVGRTALRELNGPAAKKRLVATG